MLQIKNLTYQLGPRMLFSAVNFSVPDGARVGIVGPNGAGKTTLFRIVLGEIVPDGGEISYPKDRRFVYVRQEIENPEISPLESMLSSDRDFAELRQKINDPHVDATQLADLYDAFDAAGGFTAEARARAILSGLGFEESEMENPLRQFSGGWQVRSLLASALFAPSDCLFLDEPTNHLDLETVIWLENYLRQLKKSMFIISHERNFLNRICDHTLYVHHGTAQLFRGNYDTFRSTFEAQQRSQLAERASVEQKREHLQAFVDRFRAKASKAKQAQSRIKMLEKMDEVPPLAPPYAVEFHFPKPSTRVDRRFICLEDAAIGYGETTVLRNVNFCVDEGDRIALLGANGNGKSTLAKAIASEIALQGGVLKCAKSLKIAYFSQHQEEMLDLGKTPVELFRQRCTDFNETQIRGHLAQFGISKERALTVAKKLSGGEKTRLLLSMETLCQPHLLILDEPTNHLDMEAREALAKALNAYGGAVVLVTHDFQTLQSCCQKFYIISQGSCKKFNGSIEDYRRWLLDQKK
ncbi:MAG: ATP-binding cassette domain-containing protein [Puniceicoccales bacterium]|jgi:ATP-binding cassette subfamily F protein 3|nr:ATP-binding cassette domain-containing protein [Puniceicoccales bacterium]